jgi:beta-glucosidase
MPTVEERIKDLISQMTPQEKIGLLPTRQQAIPRLGIKEYSIGAEGAHGLLVRSYYDQWPFGESTVFPQPIGLSCTWDKELMYRIGDVIGTEARVWYEKTERSQWLTLWFPTIDMERDPRWGRNEEAYGEDPYLAGKLAASLIRGTQGDDPYYVKAACAPKHFYGNNVEKDRLSTSTNISERVKHEYYLRVFEYAFLEGGALSVMTAYNEINGIPCIANPENLSIVKGKWGCEGYIVSDGDDLLQTVTFHKYRKTNAEAITVALKNGVDCFPEQKPENVTESATDAFKEGLITEEDLDRAITNTLKIRFRLGQFDPDEANPYSAITEDRLCCDEHSATALEAYRKSVVLLKNDGILPLDSETCGKVLVLGDLAKKNLPDWYSGKPPHTVSPLDAMSGVLSEDSIITVGTHDTCAIFNKEEKGWVKDDGAGIITFVADEAARTIFEEIDWGFDSVSYRNVETGKYLCLNNDLTLSCNADDVWGWFTMELFLRNEDTGDFLPHSEVFGNRYEEPDNKTIDKLASKLKRVTLSDGLAPAVKAAASVDTVILMLGNHPLINGRECFDRPSLNFPGRWTRLIEQITAVNPNTVLTLIAGYPFTFTEEEKLLRAVLYTAHGEQDVGTAVSDVLFGKYNPAGRLSMTWYKSEDDLPDINDYDIINNPRTYMYFDKPVLFPFGHGLSYTTFEYSKLTAEQTDNGYTVFCRLKNTGERAGDEVAQLYATLHGVPVKAPIRKLCGYERINLDPGEEKTLVFNVPDNELRLYDEESAGFTIIPESITFAIGASSKDIRLET